MRSLLTSWVPKFLLLAIVPTLSAGEITSIDPFLGVYSESWESFPNNGGEPQTFLRNPTSILNGMASISNPFMVIYQPGVADFYLGTSGTAQAAEGDKALGLNRSMQTADLMFTQEMSSFGAFWGASTSTFSGIPAHISVSFFDSVNNLIATEVFDYVRQGDGLLEWHGWSSTIPIKRLTYTEDFVVIDGLQANPIPEPATLALLSFAAISMVPRRRHPETARNTRQ